MLSITKARYFSAEEDKLFCPLLDHRDVLQPHLQSQTNGLQMQGQQSLQGMQGMQGLQAAQPPHQPQQHHYSKVDAHALAKVLAAARLNHTNRH